MTNPSNMALDFNAEKVSDGHIRSGWKVTLKVQPGEAPDAFVTAPLGTRWKVALVRLDENDQPVPPQQPEDKETKPDMWNMGPVKQAALFVKDYAFQQFLDSKVTQIVNDEHSAIQAVYAMFYISSRKFLADDPHSHYWQALMNEYRDIIEQQRYGDNLR